MLASAPKFGCACIHYGGDGGAICTNEAGRDKFIMPWSPEYNIMTGIGWQNEDWMEKRDYCEAHMTRGGCNKVGNDFCKWTDADKAPEARFGNHLVLQPKEACTKDSEDCQKKHQLQQWLLRGVTPN